jgi:hypothetical protein
VKVALRLDGHEHFPKEMPEDGAGAVLFGIPCPHCKAKAPIYVRGRGITQKTHDEYIADAKHTACGGAMGQLVVTVDTVFGIEEDEMVLNGRCRVY